MNNEYEHDRAILFFKSKTIVHASTGKFFTNGIILEVGKKHLIIKDRVDGKERPIFFEELIKQLEEFIPK